MPSGNFGNILAGHVAKRMGLPIRRLILATNENDVLDEFFRTGRYRPRATAETHATSSPSMDISKASNFERYVFDIVGRDPAVVRDLWQRLDADGGFDLAGTPYAAERRRVGLRVRHAARTPTASRRSATSRRASASSSTRTPPTASRSAASMRDAGVPLVCIETALPAKFAATIREALGRDPDAPPRTPISRPGRSAASVLPADVGARQGVHRRARRAPPERAFAAASPCDLDVATMRNALANLGRNLRAGLAARVVPAGGAARVPHRPRAAAAAVRRSRR